MAEITAQMVKELREKTGAGMMDCKAALAETKGDYEQAVDWLRKKGLKNVAKRSDKVASEGTVFSYIHAGGKIGVLLEMNCESDFVARGEDFQSVAKEIAMHIAWAKPKYVRREEVPAEEVERERNVLLSQIPAGKEAMAEKIIGGKLDKFYEDICLVDQIDVKEGSGKKKIQDVINTLSAKIGEKVSIRRFARYELGEGIEKAERNYKEEVEAVLAGS